MEIGEKLRRLRTEKQLTQEELANRCELSKGFISQRTRRRSLAGNNASLGRRVPCSTSTSMQKTMKATTH